MNTPAQIPTKSETITSLKINANPIAISGGSIDNQSGMFRTLVVPFLEVET